MLRCEKSFVSHQSCPWTRRRTRFLSNSHADIFRCLTKLKGDAERLDICSKQPADIGEVNATSLGNKAFEIVKKIAPEPGNDIGSNDRRKKKRDKSKT